MITEAANSGDIILTREMPALLTAMSSLFSLIWPMVHIEARRVARGMASGRMVQPPHIRNSSMTLNDRPLLTSSSMYTHRNCITRMNITTSRIATNGPMKDLSMNLSSRFIREGMRVYLVARSLRALSASDSPATSLPPAVAKPGCPPPPPWMNLAASRISLPALRPAATRSSE